MNSFQGIAEIVNAKWEKDEYGLNLRVHDNKDREIHVWLLLRPSYCDRGHIQANLEGLEDFDSADMFPRYFFSFEEADKHMRTFLMWRLWKHRIYPHKLEA